jgi:hypothetical protein
MRADSAGGARDDVDTGQIRLGDLHLRFHADRRQRGTDDALDALTHLGVVLFARHEHEARIEAPERIAAEQEAHPRPLLQSEDAGHQPDEIGHARLKQLVSRKRFEDVLQCLAVVAIGRQSEMLDHLADLVAHERNLTRVRVVGGRCPQPKEPPLADQLARGVEVLDADVIEVAGTMNRGLQVRLRHQNQIARAALATDVARQGAGDAARTLVAGTQEPEPGVLHRLEGILSLAAAQPVLLETEEREVAVFHPGKKRLCFAHVARIEARVHHVQVIRGAARCRAHLCPVGAGHAHVAHAALDVRPQRLEQRRIDDTVDLDMLKRLEPPMPIGRGTSLLEAAQHAARVACDREDRVRQEMHGQRSLRQCEPDRID